MPSAIVHLGDGAEVVRGAGADLVDLPRGAAEGTPHKVNFSEFK